MRNGFSYMKDFYSQFTKEDLWCVKEESFEKEIQSIRESQFALGNGFLGTRGVLEEIPIDAHPGTYLAGVYDRLTSQVAELVNFPNPFYFKFTVKGEKLGGGKHSGKIPKGLPVLCRGLIRGQSAHDISDEQIPSIL